MLIIRSLFAGISMLAGMPDAALAQHLTAQSVFQGQPIEVSADLAKPSGAGPFPAVVLLPGCAQQVDLGIPVWAGLFHQWGYATIYVHTLTARGLYDVCTDGKLSNAIVADMRTDVYRLAAASAADSGVKADKIAVLGRSLGSNTVVNFVATDAPETVALRSEIAARGAKIVGGVAVSPSCWTREKITLPILMLTGALDDWTTPERCLETARLNPDNAQIKVYPDAYHAFERPGPPGGVGGHRQEYNAADAQDAYATARGFLDRILH